MKHEAFTEVQPPNIIELIREEVEPPKIKTNPIINGSHGV